MAISLRPLPPTKEIALPRSQYQYEPKIVVLALAENRMVILWRKKIFFD